MNFYNENLHSSVVSSLNAQELELQKVKAQQEASMFSLYYSESERITMAEKIEVTNRKYLFEQEVHEQAITDSDLSTNVLASANNIKTYTAKSVTNTAVAAANVQVAANAILKLASDTGSIFSIISAADFGTEIYTQSQKTYELMNITAYTAELTSQHSMEASQLIAEVSSNTLEAKAATTDASVKDLLNVVTTQFNATTDELASENAQLAVANTNEKKAEGALEDISVAKNATYNAYQLSNSELNLGLKVGVPTSIGDRTNYTVSFSPYISPFKTTTPNGTLEANDAPQPDGYPVQDYYIMLVKDSKSSTFSINQAEDIVTKNDRTKFYQVSPTPTLIIPIENIDTNHRFVDQVALNGDPIRQKIYTSQLVDTDGDSMDLGDSYVVVVFAVLSTSYKKMINTFDDYMTVPSRMFTLTNQLNKVAAENITATGGETEEIIIFSDNLTTGAINVRGEEIVAVEKITFKVLENPGYVVQYRCSFLPDNIELVKGLLTVEGLMDIENETKQLEEIADIYDPLISETTEEINSLSSEISGLETQLEINNQIIANEKSKTGDKKKAEAQNPKLQASIDIKKATLIVLKRDLVGYENDKQEAIENLSKLDHIKPGFFFNLTIAEQIPAGSYTPVDKSDPDTAISVFSYLINEAKVVLSNVDLSVIDLVKVEQDIQNIITDIENLELVKFIFDITALLNDTLGVLVREIHKEFQNFINDLTLLHDGYRLYTMEIDIKPETTDSFGNRLIGGNKYTPAIVSISNSTEQLNNQFNNALSYFQFTGTFIYVDPITQAAYPNNNTTTS